MKRLTLVLCLSLLALNMAVSPAAAHLPPGEYGSFAAGFSHPLFGFDHILAMVAVGLWAGMLGGRARWAVPAAFVTVMLVGFGLALMHVSVPFVEPMILASTIVLGLLVAMAVRLDLRVCVAMVGAFALFHGHAHGGELGAADAFAFGSGFALATALLHGAGIGMGLAIDRIAASLGTSGLAAARGLGALTAVAGIALVIA